MADNKVRPRSTFYYEGNRYECVGKSQREADQKAALGAEPQPDEQTKNHDQVYF